MLFRSKERERPVNDVEGVEVADSAGHLSSIKPGSGLREAPLSLQVEEQLEDREHRETKVCVCERDRQREMFIQLCPGLQPCDITTSTQSHFKMVKD